MKNWYKSKTVWVAILMGVTGVITAMETQFALPGILLSVKAVIDLWLRANTTTGLK